MWQCPLCHTPLVKHDKYWSCSNQHTYDKAKSGYVNLHLVQQKRSRYPGDDKAMLVARRAVHDANAYEPLMACLVKLIATHCSVDPITVFDAGCGEGSYLAYLRHSLSESGKTVVAAGSDIAKPAVEMAAKKFPRCEFVVASSAHLPLIEESLDVIIQVFAPGNTEEYLRVLKPGGLLVIVEPGAQHMWEFKQRIYEQPKPHVLTEHSRNGFNLLDRQQLAFDVELPNPSFTESLLHMTPFYWSKGKRDMSEITADLSQISAEFDVQVWQREVNYQD